MPFMAYTWLPAVDRRLPKLIKLTGCCSFDKYTFKSGPLDTVKLSNLNCHLSLTFSILAMPFATPYGPFIKLPENNTVAVESISSIMGMVDAFFVQPTTLKAVTI